MATPPPIRSFNARYSQELVLLWELDGTIEWVSDNIERLLATPRELVLGLPISQLIPTLTDLDFHYPTEFDITEGQPSPSVLELRCDIGREANEAGDASEGDEAFKTFIGFVGREGERFVALLREASELQALDGTSHSADAELQALLTLAREINDRLSPEELVRKIAQHLKPFIRFDNLFISLLRDDLLESVANSDQDAGVLASKRSLTADHEIWRILDSGQIWSQEDCRFEDEQGNLISPVRAFINVPLRVEGRSIGILHFDVYTPLHWAQEELRLARFVGGQIAAVVESAELLRQKVEGERALAESLALLRATQEAAAEGICLVTESGELVSYNRRFAQLWAVPPDQEETLVQNGQLMNLILSRHSDPDEFLLKISELYDLRDASSRDEVLLCDGRVFERYSAPVRATDGRSFGRIWTFSDITDRKQAEERLAQQAFYDVVTGLPNRVLFADRLVRARAKLERTHRALAVLFLDLDRFKVINDSLGHEKGDELLKKVATRLEKALRPGDTAARFGGDEFVVLLEDLNAVDDATRIADRIANSLSAPFQLVGHEMSVTASVGIVFCSDPQESVEDLLRKADIAMYRAKGGGKAQYQVFSDVVSSNTMARLQLEIDMATAIKRGEMEVYYQPLYDLHTNRIGAFEALVRWNHTERGLISPVDFIPMAEETGHIFAIGTYVLRVACEQAKTWSDTYKLPLLMHVNLSARQFEKSDLPAQIARVLRETGLPAKQLMLEITESMLMVDAPSAAKQLEELKLLGVGISLDDFGTGYSSLSYLEWFPLDLLKIDRAFVARLGEGSLLAQAITSLGLALGVEVAAEGIETPIQLEQVKALGCRWGQGYLFSRPLPVLSAENLLQ